MAKFLSTLDKGTFKNYKEIYTSPSISTGQLTLDLSLGNIFNVSLNANITIMTISNIPSSSFAGSFTLIFTADGTPRGVAWTPAIKWPSGTAPTLTSTNGKRDVFSFVTTDGGTNWYGFVGGQNI
jgi:hypothetical protein